MTRRYDEMRAKHVAQMIAAMPEYVQRLEWSREQIALHRRRSLRLLLRVAKEYSSWHRERLRDVDPGTATEADLARVPPMTRADLMAHWDEIVIYPNLSRAMVERHVAGLLDDAYLFDSFHAVVSRGRAGQRGVFVYDWDGWLACFAGSARWCLRNRGGAMAHVAPTVADVSLEGAAHISTAINQSFCTGTFHRLPATMRSDELAVRLAEIDPQVLVGRPAQLAELARAVGEAGLAVRPDFVSSQGEPLSPELRHEVEQGFGAGRVHDAWGASEALPLAQGCPASGAMHVNDDLVVLEPVDAAGRPAAPGQRAEGVYLTNLFNLALPLIRYELPDRLRVAEEPCRCGSAYTLVDQVGAAGTDRPSAPARPRTGLTPRESAPRRPAPAPPRAVDSGAAG